jgi:hypothetical protein
MKGIIKRILNEEYQLTETEYMGDIIPSYFLEELGIKLFNEDDVASFTEIQFDTKRVVINLFTYSKKFREYTGYEDSNDIPREFKYIYVFNINDLPINFIKYIIKVLNDKYTNSYLFPFLDIIPKGIFKNI